VSMVGGTVAAGSCPCGIARPAQGTGRHDLPAPC
jgi:hypothetical protein